LAEEAVYEHCMKAGKRCICLVAVMSGALVAAACLAGEMQHSHRATHVSADGFEISSRLQHVLDQEILTRARPGSGRWNWSPTKPYPSMRSTDLVVGSDGRPWLLWIKAYLSEDGLIRSTELVLELPSKSVVLRPKTEAHITDPLIALTPEGWGVVFWREIVISREARMDLFAAAIKESGEVMWGPVLVDEGIREAAIVVDAEGFATSWPAPERIGPGSASMTSLFTTASAGGGR
jgi:hypothetical protein